MKIAIFHELPVKSGSRKSVEAIVKYLSIKNRVDVYYTGPSKSHIGNNKNTSYYFFKFSPIVWNGGNFPKRLYRDTIELVKLYQLHKKIAKLISKKNYDIVYIHASSLTESPFILRFKLPFKVYYAHAPNYTLVFEKVMGIPKVDRARYIYELFIRYIRRQIDKKNVRCANLILANSRYTKSKISAFYGRKSVVAYLGVDTSIYRPLGRKKIYDYLFVGSYHPVDGYNLLHQSLINNTKIKGRILAIEDEWITDDRKMASLYNSSKVVLCLSHGEPFGLTAIEALSCGVPVIAVDEAGYKETVIHNKTGLLVRRDPDELVINLKKLLEPKRNVIFSKRARTEAVKSWSWKSSVKRMEQIFERKTSL